ncbi:putative blue pigment (indigoidine) exporter [Acidovorax sp. 99]|uniref:EamA family transporter n=1 Tax=unclassified Acidovorax TaxID=2684926 RepID=UPI000C195347|nr:MULTISPECIES: EamA family transporter [unclassified Acidovorax]PIF17645.1 putative blue pigment (indigoidine) exporter [Acidovorax sp. 59]PKW03331.1 putative blue pigment (indigoidine) exporter [Acidovorax sp. 30]PVY93076.1 putative blue pigment (indigoidine) exporter [Acidovorax sp. 99]
MAASRASASSSTWLDALTTALGPVIWGSTYIVTTELLPPDRPFTAALLRTLPAGLLLVLWCRRWPAWGDWVGWRRLMVLAALNIGVFQALLFVAAYRLPGGVAAVVGAVGPLVVMGLTWALDHRRPPALALAAGALGVLGMAALLLSPGARWDMVGVAAALVGTLCMAAGTFWSRRWRSDLPVLAFTGWQLLAGGVMLAPVAWAVDPPLPALTPTHIAGYLYLSLAGALVAYALWFRGIARLPSVAVSSLGLLSPVTAVLLGWALLGQAMTGVSLVGMLVVLASILAVQWAMSRAMPPGGR